MQDKVCAWLRAALIEQPNPEWTQYDVAKLTKKQLDAYEAALSSLLPPEGSLTWGMGRSPEFDMAAEQAGFAIDFRYERCMQITWSLVSADVQFVGDGGDWSPKIPLDQAEP